MSPSAEAPGRRVFSYVVANDCGFAPHPFFGFCTLACCKPKIRKVAKPGDLVVGLSPRCERIVYVMRVSEALSFAEYWSDPRFRNKRAVWVSRRLERRFGDNIYEPTGGGYRQLRSQHWDHERDAENDRKKHKDTRVDRVLVSEDFVYFGGEGPGLPPHLEFLRVARSHRSRFEDSQVREVERLFRGLARGVEGRPTTWPDDTEPSAEPSVPQPCSGRRPARRRTRPAPADAARMILSRKGMDSGAGGSPSPILPDGTLLPLPIPDRRSPVRYKDIWLRGHNLGTVAEGLTRGRVKAKDGAHLDPDLDAEALSRARRWRPIFGTAGAAQKVLANCEVGAGDVFVFFGWFRRTELADGGLRYVQGAPDLHVLYGWLQVGEVVPIANGGELPWAASHPHLAVPDRRNNAVYVASSELVLEGKPTGLPGAGSFGQFRPELQLTAPGSSRSIWRLPAWFYPSRNKPPLGYHADKSRWSRDDGAALLRSAHRGQEFVLPMAHYPEAPGWLRAVIQRGRSPKRRGGRRASAVG